MRYILEKFSKWHYFIDRLMLCVCSFYKPIKGYILRMIRKARLVRATVDVHISSVNPKMIFAVSKL